MEPSPSDVDCLARSLSEPKAFELIFDRHFGPIHSYLHRRAGRDLADELAAETFALAFERRASCPPDGPVARLHIVDRYLRFEYLPRTDANLALTDIRAQHPNATVVDPPIPGDD
jgi:DNA-directed RNA polymerase specialized sigma24 family protein